MRDQGGPGAQELQFRGIPVTSCPPPPVPQESQEHPQSQRCSTVAPPIPAPRAKGITEGVTGSNWDRDWELAGDTLGASGRYCSHAGWTGSTTGAPGIILGKTGTTLRVTGSRAGATGILLEAIGGNWE